jgi:hypothetical protein
MDTLIQQKIMAVLQNLDSSQLSEVLDFVEFLNRKGKIVHPVPNIIDALCGKYQGRLSDSEDFAKRKMDELKKEEGKWQAK